MAGKAQLPSLRGTLCAESTHALPRSAAGQALRCRITPWIPCSADNYAALNYLLNLFESGGGLSHFQTIKVNYMGKYCCHYRV